MNRSRKSNTRLAVESLEPRWLMAGNVTAEVVPMSLGGNAVAIIGDNEANQIRVTEVTAEHIRVQGLEGTTVNGKAVDDLFAAGDIFMRVDVDLGNGNDTHIHEFTGDQFRHSIGIDTGNGNDLVSVYVRGVLGNLAINTGSGNDEVILEMAPVSLLDAGLRIDTGVGNDDVLVRSDSDGGLPELVGNSWIRTEQGDDLVRFEGAIGIGPWGVLWVDLGSGDDTLIGDSDEQLYGLTAWGGDGHDTVLNASFFEQLMFFEMFIDEE